MQMCSPYTRGDPKMGLNTAELGQCSPYTRG